MNSTIPPRRRLMLCAGVSLTIVALVNALVAGIAALGVMECGFIWYCACLLASALSVIASAAARTRLRVLLSFPAVSAYVYAFGVAMPDPASPAHLTSAIAGFVALFFGCPAPAIYLAVIAVVHRHREAKRAQLRALVHG